MKNRVIQPALLTVIGVLLVGASVATNLVLQNGDRYTSQYLLVGIPGVLLIVWNAPTWLRTKRKNSA